MRTLSEAREAARFSRDAQMITGSTEPHSIVFVNSALLDLFGYAAEDVSQQNVSLLHGPLTSRDELRALDAALLGKQQASAELVLYDKAGETSLCHVVVEPLFDDSLQAVSHRLLSFWPSSVSQEDSWCLASELEADDANDAILGAKLDRLLPGGPESEREYGELLSGGSSGTGGMAGGLSAWLHGDDGDGDGSDEFLPGEPLGNGTNAASAGAGLDEPDAELGDPFASTDLETQPLGCAAASSPPQARGVTPPLVSGGSAAAAAAAVGAAGPASQAASLFASASAVGSSLLGSCSANGGCASGCGCAASAGAGAMPPALSSSHTHHSGSLSTSFKIVANVDSSVFRVPLTLEAALEPSSDMIVVTEAVPPYRIVHVNAAWSRVCGYSAEEAIGQSMRILQGPGTCRASLRKLAEAVAACQPLTVMLLNYTAERKPFMNSICVMPLQPPSAQANAPVRPWHYVGVCKATPLDPEAASRAIALVSDSVGPLAGGTADGGLHGGPSDTRDAAHAAELAAAGVAKPRVAPFISKLFKMVSATETDFCIKWGADGRSFIVTDMSRFEAEVLPSYFRHNRFSSFSQQLHTYNFVQKAPASCLDQSLEYAHEHFSLACPDRLHEIKRGTTPAASREAGSGLGGGSSARGGVGGGSGGKRPREEVPEVAHVQEMIHQHKTRILNIDKQFNMAHKSIRMLMMQICEKLVSRCYQANGGLVHGSKYEGLVSALQQMHTEVATSTQPHAPRTEPGAAAGGVGCSSLEAGALALPFGALCASAPSATPAGPILPPASFC